MEGKKHIGYYNGVWLVISRIGRHKEEGISGRDVTTGTSDLLVLGAEGKESIKNGQEGTHLKN